MDDRELLALAAKAAGLTVRLVLVDGSIDVGLNRPTWNPLTDDGDAMRLAAALNFDVCVNICFCEVLWVNLDTSETFEFNEDWGAGDVDLPIRMRYIRRAIVRAAAAIGKDMP
jgi:hypothetical protein